MIIEQTGSGVFQNLPLVQSLAETNEEKIANVLEILLIAFYKSFGCQLTNGTEGGTGGLTFKGRRHSIESRLKMSKRLWNYKKYLSEVTKKKISKILKGRKNTLEQGKKQSEAQKISESGKGKHHWSKEARLRQSKLYKGKKLSKEHREKIGNAHRDIKYKLRRHDNSPTIL